MLGETKARITTKKSIETDLKFIVVELGYQPIIEKSSCKRLDLIRRVETMDKKDDLFQELGCLKNFIYDIDLVDNADLKIHSPRTIPYSIKEEVKKELDCMVQLNIIKALTEPTPAVFPMVSTSERKTSFIHRPDKHQTQSTLLTLPLQTQEIAVNLHGSKYFTKLDCTKGFW